tara:strand:+ start:134 stop:430 length:297 start_codon:yes stop_codon:yes gene_type:complete
MRDGMFEVVVLIFFLSIYVRMWFVMRDFKYLYNRVNELHAHVFMEPGDIQVGDGDNYQVMSLDEFTDRFGFDPRDAETTPATDGKASSEVIDAWDNDR